MSRLNVFLLSGFLHLSLFGAPVHENKAANVIQSDRPSKKQVISQLPFVEGWCSKEKASLLYDFIINEKPKTCVEIGVFGGASILPIATALKVNCNNAVVYAIDPWKTEECLKGHDKANADWWSKVNLDSIYKSFVNLVTRNSLQNQVVILKQTAEGALTHIPAKIDFLHIDGNHGEEAVNFDVDNYFPRVKKGGIIVCDDVHWQVNGKRTTKGAYDKMMSSCTVIASCDKGECLFLRKTR
jgi:predicted O-methyltransferase YrrM